MTMNDVLVQMPEGMKEDEAKYYVDEEIKSWESKGKVLGKVVLELDKDEVVIKAFEKSPIRRIRRITGYLSEQTNFNDAKRAELAQRTYHFS
ncbi:MAG: anaerobic ribonucleoside triphosphate reductase [Firmicutes bacterium]|nr:anaerobic ribonucleoside triphosphate reductase [Bacillota bacterium]